jgi:hypothetical protein
MARSASFVQYMRAHGNTPGPTQRPVLAGAITGFVAELPATAMLWWSGALASLADVDFVSDRDDYLRRHLRPGFQSRGQRYPGRMAVRNRLRFFALDDWTSDYSAMESRSSTRARYGGDGRFGSTPPLWPRPRFTFSECSSALAKKVSRYEGAQRTRNLRRETREGVDRT